MPEFSETFRALVRRYVPVDYLALHPATVRSQATDGTIEVEPDNPRIPAVAGVPIRAPFPDTTIKVAAGARVLLGFEGGSPKARYAIAWSGSGLTEVSIGNGDYVALANLVQEQLTALKNAIANGTTSTSLPGGVPDGGAVLQQSIVAALTNWPSSVAATKVKAE